MTISCKLICPKCGAKNNRFFVMCCGDKCKKCDFHIKPYINGNKKEKLCPYCDTEIGEMAVWCWSCGREIKKQNASYMNHKDASRFVSES